MKKPLYSLLALLLASRAFAQTPATNSVLINGSYVANTYIFVHPYVPSAASATPSTGAGGSISGNTPAPASSDPDDAKISFRLNKGTKFFVNKIVTSNNTITGYVISVWSYSNPAEKTNFYATLNPAGAPNPIGKSKPATGQQQQQETNKKELATLSDAINLQQQSVNAQSDEVNSQTKKLTDEKQAIVALQAALEKARTAFYSASLYYNSNDADFKTLQATAQSRETMSNTVSPTEQDELIKKSLTINSTDATAFMKMKKAYQDADKAVSDANTKITTDETALSMAMADLAAKQATLRTQLNNFTAVANQTANDPKGKKFYNITKLQVGDPQDDLTNDQNPAKAYDALAYVDSWANGWQFYMSAKDFSDNTTMVYPRNLQFTWGFLTLPIKLRFDNPKFFNNGGEFNFEQNLNFGLTFGFKQQWTSTNDISMNYLLGLSVDNVPLNASAETTTDNAQGTAPPSTFAISTSAGVMFQYNKFQIGIFGGTDFAGAHANEFPYQGRFWLGFAIGVSLFGEGQTSAGAQKQ